MIALLAALLSSAFPVRGSLLQTLDSVFVLDRDTVRLTLAQCPCMCPNGTYEIELSRDSTKGFQPFPGTIYPGGRPKIAQRSGQLPTTSSPLTSCVMSNSIPPSDSRKFLLRGVSGNWAVWADSVYPWTSTTRTYDTSNGIINTTLHQKETFKARWRWSRIDTAVPFVRWVDTVQLKNGTAPVGLPVLSTLSPLTPGYLAPQSEMMHLGLVLRDLTDSVAPIDWGYRDRLLPKPELVPAGRTFRVLDAYNNNGGTIRWDLQVNGTTRDEFLVVGQATADALPSQKSEPVRWGTVGREISTGRAIRLESPRPVGPQILSGPTGIRMIVVE